MMRQQRKFHLCCYDALRGEKSRGFSNSFHSRFFTSSSTTTAAMMSPGTVEKEQEKGERLLHSSSSLHFFHSSIVMEPASKNISSHIPYPMPQQSSGPPANNAGRKDEGDRAENRKKGRKDSKKKRKSGGHGDGMLGTTSTQVSTSVSASSPVSSLLHHRQIPSSCYSTFRTSMDANVFHREFEYIQAGERRGERRSQLHRDHLSQGDARMLQKEQTQGGGKLPELRILSEKTVDEKMKSGMNVADDDDNVAVSLGGRVVAIRDMGKVVFFTLRSNGKNVQIVVNVGDHFSVACLTQLKSTIHRGDVVGVRGVPGRTKRGELSIFAQKFEILAPYVCSDLVCCPDQTGRQVFENEDVKYRYRFMDLVTNPSLLDTFKLRHRVLNSLREFLNARHFTEVETPMFHTVPGGAAAKPFLTHHNAHGADLYLRVAPELYLKQCVVGGMERVYEVGKVFRNEDTDRSHNPEYTMCEFYMAYSNYQDLMTLTEELLQSVCFAVHDTTQLQVTPRNHINREGGLEGKKPNSVTIDFSKPFHRISVLPTLEERIGMALPHPVDMESSAGTAFLAAICLRHGIPLPEAKTAAKLLDKLIDHFITDHIVEPTFVMDHPTFMSPLAKSHAADSSISERFELFVNGMELCNAYSELTDPTEQLERFQQQLSARNLGDDEAQSIDETFLKALQVGLPPTAGWGMGIDRLMMLLTGSNSIRDVILFPLLKTDENSHDTKRRNRTASFFGFSEHMTLFCLGSLEKELQSRGESRACEELRNLRKVINTMCKNRCGTSSASEDSCGQFFRKPPSSIFCDPTTPTGERSLMCALMAMMFGRPPK